MKKIAAVVLIICSALIFLNCASAKLTPEQMEALKKKVETPDVKFTARSATPMGGKMIHLSSDYSLIVTKDSVEAYLPYFGRAYSADLGGDGGIKFKSKKFDYSLQEDKKGMWNMKIVPHDVKGNYKLYLNIGNSGYATLMVEDVKRQSISYYGTVY